MHNVPVVAKMLVLLFATCLLPKSKLYHRPGKQVAGCRQLLASSCHLQWHQLGADSWESVNFNC